MYLVDKVFPSLRNSGRSVRPQPPLIIPITVDLSEAPDDILQIVFEVYTQDLSLSPANLLTVCRRWYRLMLATPSLWSRVNIPLYSVDTIPNIVQISKPDGGDSDLTRAEPRLVTYLKRSIPSNSIGGLPLDITIKSHFNYTFVDSKIDKFQSQFDSLIDCLQGGQPGTRQNPSLETLFITRWRSLEINLNSLSYHLGGHPILDFRIFEKRGHIKLPSLHRLVCRKLTIYHAIGDQLPELKHLELRGCTRYSVPSLRSVEWLSLRNVEYRFIPIMNWKDCKNMKTVYISFDFSFDVPNLNLIPNLTCIRLENSALTILPKLGLLFDDSRPLPVLEIRSEFPGWITIGLGYTVRSFRVLELGISSYGFRGRPSTIDWEWLEYGTGTWNIRDGLIEETIELLGRLEEFGGKGAICLRAMDAQMDAILLRCNERLNDM